MPVMSLPQRIEKCPHNFDLLFSMFHSNEEYVFQILCKH